MKGGERPGAVRSPAHPGLGVHPLAAIEAAAAQDRLSCFMQRTLPSPSSLRHTCVRKATLPLIPRVREALHCALALTKDPRLEILPRTVSNAGWTKAEDYTRRMTCTFMGIGAEDGSGVSDLRAVENLQKPPQAGRAEDETAEQASRSRGCSNAGSGRRLQGL
ncbi:unnamed protein product [Rangifer tarandus platyrhynchus]|uniref:Uncharacterized protein n=1 Tax=Rangifer tarandus platyrhynchus TaxID=3082113 RepID=A0ABN8Y4U8_RANTA|nr:unnamed protein product [Rangifer tarandus platyrhynchus]